MVLEKTLESPLDCKEIQQVHSKGNQSWVFTGRIDAKVEIPILWSPDARNWLTGKDLMLGKIEGGRRSGQQRMWWLDISLTQWTWVWLASGSWWWTGKPSISWNHNEWTQLSDWTELNWTIRLILLSLIVPT